jgi:2-methylcitrate dehydratase PrpD
MCDTAYKRHPTETITQAPIDCVLAVRGRFPDGPPPRVERMRFLVEPIVARVSAERFARFGTPRTDLQARFDLRFCAASAWTRNRFTLAEMAEAAYTDPEILALRGRVDVDADEQWTINGAHLEVTFEGGRVETVSVDPFRGAGPNPLTDDELSDVFRGAASWAIPAKRAERVLSELWALESAPSVKALVEATRP